MRRCRRAAAHAIHQVARELQLGVRARAQRNRHHQREQQLRFSSSFFFVSLKVTIGIILRGEPDAAMPISAGGGPVRAGCHAASA